MNDTVIEIEIGQNYRVKVNADTWERLKLARFRWRPQIHKAKDKVYAQANAIVTIAMHRLIAGAKKGEYVDHINGDGLDNRDCNLRIANAQQNRANSRKCTGNTSGYKGVTWSTSSRKWHAQIVAHGIRYHLGVFPHIKRAARAHDAAALAIHGEFASINFPDNPPRPRKPKLPVKRQ